MACIRLTACWQHDVDIVDLAANVWNGFCCCRRLNAHVAQCDVPSPVHWLTRFETERHSRYKAVSVTSAIFSACASWVYSGILFALVTALDAAIVLQALHLSGSPDLVCMNLMCEKLGQPCLCRVSLALQRLVHLTTLDLSGNALSSVPDAVDPQYLPSLQVLNLSRNNIAELPSLLSKFPNLKVLPAH
jgi:hypothetical protein